MRKLIDVQHTGGKVRSSVDIVPEVEVEGEAQELISIAHDPIEEDEGIDDTDDIQLNQMCKQRPKVGQGTITCSKSDYPIVADEYTAMLFTLPRQRARTLRPVISNVSFLGPPAGSRPRCTHIINGQKQEKH